MSWDRDLLGVRGVLDDLGGSLFGAAVVDGLGVGVDIVSAFADVRYGVVCA